MFRLFILIIFSQLLCFSCNNSKNSNNKYSQQYPNSFVISVANPIDVQRKDASITLNISELLKKYKDFNPASFILLSDTTEIAAQADDLNLDSKADEITFVLDFQSKEAKNISVLYNPIGEQKRSYKKRTQAELSHKFGGKWESRKYIGGAFKNVDYLRIPAEHTDHSFFIRYEGPGWESDKIAYRFYLDWRNGFDIFGKKVPDMVLQNVGLDGFDSYHNPSPWGQDNFKAGKALGIGSFGMLKGETVEHVSVTDSVDCRIVLNGAVKSLIKTNYFGWKVDEKKFNVTTELSILAGSRMTYVDMNTSGNPDNLAVGFVKKDEKEAKFIEISQPDSKWGIIASFGKQSLTDDNLGLAIVYPKDIYVKTVKAELDNVVLLKPIENKVRYYFLATWEQEPNGIKTEADFVNYLQQILKELNAPIEVKI